MPRRCDGRRCARGCAPRARCRPRTAPGRCPLPDPTTGPPRVPAMSTHIGAAAGQVAPAVLMPGDPLRARWIAETMLEDATCYTEVRGMYGYTGTWRGNRVSVQGSGMGMPSISIYLNELFSEYDVQSVVRVGSCGALTEELQLRDMVIASGACTDSAMNRIRFEGL